MRKSFITIQCLITTAFGGIFQRKMGKVKSSRKRRGLHYHIAKLFRKRKPRKKTRKKKGHKLKLNVKLHVKHKPAKRKVKRPAKKRPAKKSPVYKSKTRVKRKTRK